MTVTATPLERVELTRTISMNGSVYAWQDVIISSEVGGYRVAEVLVDVGDRVRKGQQLVVVVDGVARSRGRDEASDAEAARSRAHERAVGARARRSRWRRRMCCRKPISIGSRPSSWRRSRGSSRRAPISRRRSCGSSSRRSWRPTTASSRRARSPSARSRRPATRCCACLRNGRIEWRGEAPETRLSELGAGQGVSVTTADGTPFHGKIRVVAPTISANDRTALVYVDLPADERLRPGMFARGEIAIGTGPAYMVPLESVVSAGRLQLRVRAQRGQRRRAPPHRDGRRARRARSRSSAASKPASASSTRAPAS